MSRDVQLLVILIFIEHLQHSLCFCPSPSSKLPALLLSYLTIIYSRKQTSIHNHYNDHHFYFMRTTYEIFFTFILQSNKGNLSMTTHYKNFLVAYPDIDSIHHLKSFRSFFSFRTVHSILGLSCA
jgi:hypothetical protein